MTSVIRDRLNAVDFRRRAHMHIECRQPEVSSRDCGPLSCHHVIRIELCFLAAASTLDITVTIVVTAVVIDVIIVIDINMASSVWHYQRP